MARKGPDYAAPVRRILVALLVLVLLGIFLFWQIDSPRAERMRVFKRWYLTGLEPVAERTLPHKGEFTFPFLLKVIANVIQNRTLS